MLEPDEKGFPHLRENGASQARTPQIEHGRADALEMLKAYVATLGGHVQGDGAARAA